MMLHMFLDKGDWFHPKRYGYGAGFPCKWQGWALIGSYIALVIGSGQFAGSTGGVVRLSIFALFLAVTVLVIILSKNRTRGGWRWRWGEKD